METIFPMYVDYVQCTLPGCLFTVVHACSFGTSRRKFFSVQKYSYRHKRYVCTYPQTLKCFRGNLIIQQQLTADRRTSLVSILRRYFLWEAGIALVNSEQITRLLGGFRIIEEENTDAREDSTSPGSDVL